MDVWKTEAEWRSRAEKRKGKTGWGSRAGNQKKPTPEYKKTPLRYLAPRQWTSILIKQQSNDSKLIYYLLKMLQFISIRGHILSGIRINLHSITSEKE